MTVLTDGVIIDGVKYYKWQKFYWLPIEEIKHDCGQKLTRYKKFRKWKGKMEEIRQGARICPSCQTQY